MDGAVDEFPEDVAVLCHLMPGHRAALFLHVLVQFSHQLQEGAAHCFSYLPVKMYMKVYI